MSIAIYAGMGIDRDSVYHDNRDWLRRSKSAIKAGYLIAGAALLQMGIRVVLEANLKYWCARPKHRSLVEMAKAIWLAGHATYVILTEVISHATAVIRCEQEVGNVAFLLLRRR